MECKSLDKFESLAFLTELMSNNGLAKPDGDQFMFYFDQFDRQKTGQINEDDFTEFVRYYVI